MHQTRFFQKKQNKKTKKKTMGKIITKELMKEETSETPRDPYLNPRLFGRGNERIKKLINREKIFDYNIVMFRSTKYYNRFEYISIQLSTPVTEPGNNANQIKDGYTFLINDSSPFFDWHNAYLDITFKVNKVAGGGGYAADVAIAMISAAPLISYLRVKKMAKLFTMGLIYFE